MAYISFRVNYEHGPVQLDRQACFVRIQNKLAENPHAKSVTYLVDYPSSLITDKMADEYLAYIISKFGDVAEKEVSSSNVLVTVKLDFHFLTAMMPLMYSRALLEEPMLIRNILRMFEITEYILGRPLSDAEKDALFLFAHWFRPEAESSPTRKRGGPTVLCQMLVGNPNHVVFANIHSRRLSVIKRYITREYPVSPPFTVDYNFNGNITKTAIGISDWSWSDRDQASKCSKKDVLPKFVGMPVEDGIRLYLSLLHKGGILNEDSCTRA